MEYKALQKDMQCLTQYWHGVDQTKSASKLKIHFTYRKHVMTFFINLIIFLLNIKLSEEIEGNYCIYVHNYSQKHHGEDQLFSIVCDRLQDSAQCLESNSNVQ